MTKGQVDYSKGLIYGIYCRTNEDFYIGSTTNLEQRWSTHKAMTKHRNRDYFKTKNKLYEVMEKNGIENYYIELIEYYPCNTKRELERREGELQRERKPTLNTIIIKERYDEISLVKSPP
jgi:group I intron endonuclease